jgi:glycosyltransferase involved in cell wall biosynthesis
MRILYAADYYPHGTETYIEAEIRAAIALGVDIHVWTMNTQSRLPHPVSGPVHSGLPLAQCIAEVRPDLVHAYYLNIGAHLLEEIRPSGVAFTIRAHGYEYNLELLNRLAADRAVTRILVFPHMADDAKPELRAKIAVLPTMYNAAFYTQGGRHDPRLVVRMASAVRTKNLEQFMRAATLCPNHRFVLALGQGFDFNFAAAADYKTYNAKLGNPVEVRENLDWAAAARLLGEAGIYVYTPPTHRPGMPISVAEAMASGCLVVAPDIEGMRAYLGDSGGRLYRSVEEAAEIIHSTGAWGTTEWRKVQASAAAHAARHYANNVLGPKLVAIWRAAIAKAHPCAPGLFRRIAQKMVGAPTAAG